MKIAIIILNLGAHGGVRVLCKLADAWSDMGHQVTFVVLQDGTAHWKTKASIVVSPYAAKKFSTWNFVRSVVWSGFISAKLGDIAFSTHGSTCYAALISRVLGTPVVHYVQSYEPEVFFGKGFKKAAFRFFSKLTYQLPFVRVVNAPLYMAYGALRAKHCIPPGIDLQLFHPKLQKSVRDVPLIGCIASNAWWKGTPTIVEAFRSLRQGGAPMKFAVAFGGSQFALESNAAFEIEEPKNDQELADFYRKCDLLITAGTLQNGAPHYPVLESLAVGTELLTTDYLPATPNNAIIMSALDVKERGSAAIVTGIESWLSATTSERQARIDDGLRTVVEYSWEAVGNRFHSLLVQIVSRK